jgi:hypothetical protein
MGSPLASLETYDITATEGTGEEPRAAAAGVLGRLPYIGDLVARRHPTHDRIRRDGAREHHHVDRGRVMCRRTSTHVEQPRSGRELAS